MKNLNSLLQRFSNLLDIKDRAKEAVSISIKEYTNINIPTEDISIKSRVLEISTTQAKKSEIMMKEEKIVSSLRNLHKIYIDRILYK